MRCAVIQAKIAREYGPQARDGSGRLAEVYPAASLKLWGIRARGYKGRGGAEAGKLSSAVADWPVKAPWLDLAGVHGPILRRPMTCSMPLSPP